MTCNFLQKQTGLPQLKGNVKGQEQLLLPSEPFNFQLRSAVVSMQCASRVEGKGAAYVGFSCNHLPFPGQFNSMGVK